MPVDCFPKPLFHVEEHLAMWLRLTHTINSTNHAPILLSKWRQLPKISAESHILIIVRLKDQAYHASKENDILFGKITPCLRMENSSGQRDSRRICAWFNRADSIIHYLA